MELEVGRDTLCVVFCRICGLKGMAADGVAASVRALRDVCAEVKKEHQAETVGVHSSVYGRFVCAKSVAPALEMAKGILVSAAERGVVLAIGITSGRAEPVEDFSGKNIIGRPINLAARLAALEQAEGRIVVAEEVAKQAKGALKKYRRAFDKPRDGKVKRTSFRYCSLRHEPPPDGHLSVSGVSYREVQEAHSVVYDAVRFSELSNDEAWRVLTDLKRAVSDVLVPLGGRDRAKAGKLWYAPAGDGGVLVFSPEDRGGDTALRFAEDLAEECRGKVEIRLGIATGSMVVVDKDLPVGSGILLADRMSSHPQPWQICVNQAFWDTRRDSARRQWVPAAVPDDPDALLLAHPTAGLPPPPPPLRPVSEDAKEVFRSVVRWIGRKLAHHPETRAALEEALRSSDPERRRAAADIVDVVLEAGLSEVLVTLHEWLSSESRRDDAGTIREIIAALATLGVSPAAVLEQRRELDGGHLGVQDTIDLFSAEIVLAALLDRAPSWEKSKAGSGFPVGKDYVPLGSQVEPESPTAAFRSKEAKEAVMKACCIDPQDARADEKLQQHLRAFRKIRKPLYSLFEQRDDLPELLKADPSLAFFIVLQKRSEQSETLPEPREIMAMLNEVFDHLDRLGDWAGSNGSGQ